MTALLPSLAFQGRGAMVLQGPDPFLSLVVYSREEVLFDPLMGFLILWVSAQTQ